MDEALNTKWPEFKDDLNAKYYTLRIDNDEGARCALLVYAAYLDSQDTKKADELREWIYADEKEEKRIDELLKSR